MNIGLIDVDGHNFPNLALMKLSAWHKNQGHKVEFALITQKYDIVYKSKIFTFTPDNRVMHLTDKLVVGGTGYKDYDVVLQDEIEHIYPDYNLYNVNYAVGFATRGCPNKCKWCVVPDKEGAIKPHAEIAEFWKDQKDVVLLDNNILAHEHGLNQLEWSIDKCRIDCNQGMDARIIAKDIEIQKLLARVSWSKYIRLACDNQSQMESVRISVENIRKFAGRKVPFFVYTLITHDKEDSLKRINFIRDLDSVDAFAQPYRDFTPNQKIPKWQKDIARWVNLKWVFRSTDWEGYSGSLTNAEIAKSKKVGLFN